MDDKSLIKFVIKHPWISLRDAVFGWYVLIPFGVALVWGVYTQGNIFGTAGVVTRRVGVSTITETRPIGESMLNITQGRGAVTGTQEGTRIDLTPPSERNTERPYQDPANANQN